MNGFLIFLCVVVSICYLIQWIGLLMNIDRGYEAIHLDTRFDFLMWLVCPCWILCVAVGGLIRIYKTLPSRAENVRQQKEARHRY
jgi:hypothetical protein